MRTALLSLLVASLFGPWPVEAIHVPEVSLDLPRDHVCIHRRQVPGNYGSTTTFVYGQDVSTNQLFALAEVAAEWVQFCPTDEQLAGAVQEYEEEYLADAIHHPLFRRGFLELEDECPT